MNQILMLILSIGIIIGGADRLLGNKFGYGDKFEEGFRLLGPTALSMAGMICLAPVLADVLGQIVIPLYQAAGVDPAMFGSILAIDMGGYQLAKELAVDNRIGSYAGIVVSAIFGCTLVFTVPIGMGMVRKEDRKFFAKGIMLGLTAMPAGLFVGGLLSHLSLWECLHQNLPVFAAALLLLLGLWKIPDQMVKGFCILADGIRAFVTIGLVLAAVKSLCGWDFLPRMTPIEDAMEIVSSIGVVMLGSLPVAELLRRMLEKPFTFLGRQFGLKPQSLTGMLIGCVSAIPVFSLYSDMDPKGKTAAGAFLVSGTSLLAAQMAFTVSAEPEMMPALICGKSCGAFAAVALALCFREKTDTSFI